MNDEKPSENQLQLLAKLWFNNVGLSDIVGLLRMTRQVAQFEIERALRRA